MKKTASLLFLFLFLISHSGVAVTIHWCGGKISSVGLFSQVKPGCKCGKKPMKPGCCKDKTTVLKVKSNLSNTSKITLKQPIQEEKSMAGNKPSLVVWSNSPYLSSFFHFPPPFKDKHPIYLLDSVFLL